MEQTGNSGLKGFKITASINYEIKFGEDGIEMTYEPQTNVNKLISLLMAQSIAENAKANFNENLEQIKHDKKFMDRLNWAGKTIKGLDVFIDSFIKLVIEENTIPEIKVEEKTEINTNEPFCVCLHEQENNLPRTKRCFAPCMAQREIMEKRKGGGIEQKTTIQNEVKEE